MDRIINPFDDVQVQESSVDSTKKNAVTSSLEDINNLQVGAGVQAFKVDQSGMWLGADKFADAPFRVDMEGNTTLRAATLVVTDEYGYRKVVIGRFADAT